MSTEHHPAEGGLAPALREGGRVKPDVKAGVVLLVCSAIAFAATFTFESIPDGLIQGLGAAAFPRLVIGVIVVLSLVLIWQGRRDPAGEIEPVHPMTVVTVAGQVAFMALLPILGMIASMFVFMVGLGRLWGAPRWSAMFVVSAVTVGAVYGLFTEVFGISVPLGMLESLTG